MFIFNTSNYAEEISTELKIMGAGHDKSCNPELVKTLDCIGSAGLERLVYAIVCNVHLKLEKQA